MLLPSRASVSLAPAGRHGCQTCCSERHDKGAGRLDKGRRVPGGGQGAVGWGQKFWGSQEPGNRGSWISVGVPGGLSEGGGVDRGRGGWIGVGVLGGPVGGGGVDRGRGSQGTRSRGSWMGQEF